MRHFEFAGNILATIHCSVFGSKFTMKQAQYKKMQRAVVSGNDSIYGLQR